MVHLEGDHNGTYWATGKDSPPLCTVHAYHQKRRRLDSAADHQVVVLAGEDRIKSALIKEDGKHMLKRIPQGYGWSGHENINWSDKFLATVQGANCSLDSDIAVKEWVVGEDDQEDGPWRELPSNSKKGGDDRLARSVQLHQGQGEDG